MAPDRDDLRTFGRRRGRKPSPRQSVVLERVLPRVRLDLDHPLFASLAELFPGNITEVWLEIGFGGGEHLLWNATRLPHIGFIGCEPFQDGVIKLLAGVDERRLENVRVHADDARPLIRWLPPSSLSRVDILFPDPWPKKRHIKRRLVSPEFLGALAPVMRSGAELRVATDIGDYARTVLAAVQHQTGFRWTAIGPADWRTPPDDRPVTRYEQKAMRDGRQRYYFSFRRL